LKGSSSDHCTEAKSEEAFLLVHEEETTSGSHAPPFWVKLHKKRERESAAIQHMN